MSAESVHRAVKGLADGFAADRRERQQRVALDRQDFRRLTDAGLQTIRF
jgi:hypothetical protein